VSRASYQLAGEMPPGPRRLATPVAVPGAGSVAWRWSHLVDDVSEARMPAQLPRGVVAEEQVVAELRPPGGVRAIELSEVAVADGPPKGSVRRAWRGCRTDAWPWRLPLGSAGVGVPSKVASRRCGCLRRGWRARGRTGAGPDSGRGSSWVVGMKPSGRVHRGVGVPVLVVTAGGGACRRGNVSIRCGVDVRGHRPDGRR
jgi:hypothetical protein